MADFFFGFDTSLAVSKPVPIRGIFCSQLCLKNMENTATKVRDRARLFHQESRCGFPGVKRI